jgi:hypothetical protein
MHDINLINLVGIAAEQVLEEFPGAEGIEQRAGLQKW